MAATQPGGFTVNAGTGAMECGYCGRTESWSQAALGYWMLNGFWMLGVHHDTNTLVVLAEAETLRGDIVYLPHHCLKIPASAHQEFASESVLARESVAVA